MVTGSGKAFCAGMDLSAQGNVFGLDESYQPTMEEMRTRLNDPLIDEGVRDTGGKLTLTIFDCKKPIIAAINGAAVGIGATMTCAMDIRLASESARVGFVFNKIGITPEACSSWFLPRIVGMGTALEWNLTGEILSAEEVCKKGFVRAVVSSDRLMEEAYELAGHMSRFSPVAMALTRLMMYRNAAAPDPLEAHRVDSLAIFHCSQNSGREGVAAFLEKRRPQFTDKVSSKKPAFYPWW